MKSLITIALITSSSALALSFLDSHEGDFTSPKTIALPSLKDRSSCQAADGYWKNNACFFNTSDDVSVYRAQDGYDVTVSTVGNDSSSCRFEGVGSTKDDGSIVTSVPTALGPCEMTLRYSGADWVSARSVGACHTLCENDSVSLDIIRAKRVEISGP
jgi:hypothetical protein